MKTQSGLEKGPDNKQRCWWCLGSADYLTYHDNDWGYPVTDDFRLFEKLSLEGFQAGLSWLTILRKRENFRKAFADFEYPVIARYRKQRVETLLKNSGIVRHRGKIEAVLHNAKQACKLADEYGSLAAYIWQFEPTKKARPKRIDLSTVRELTMTPESHALSRDLRKRGWKFVGPTTMYAFMQAMGLVNDHLHGCVIRGQVERSRRAFSPPPSLPT